MRFESDIIENLILKMSIGGMNALSEYDQKILQAAILTERSELMKLSFDMRVEVQRYDINEAEQKWRIHWEEYQKKQDFLATKLDEMRTMEKKLKKLKKEVALARQELEKTKINLRQFNESHQEKEVELRRMQEVVLIHPSASLKQLKEHQRGKIIVTEADREIFSFLAPDEIYSPFEAEREKMSALKLPKGFWKQLKAHEAISVLQFCHCARLKENEKPILLYNSEQISDILQMNL